MPERSRVGSDLVLGSQGWPRGLGLGRGASAGLGSRALVAGRAAADPRLTALTGPASWSVVAHWDLVVPRTAPPRPALGPVPSFLIIVESTTALADSTQAEACWGHCAFQLSWHRIDFHQFNCLPSLTSYFASVAASRFASCILCVPTSPDLNSSC